MTPEIPDALPPLDPKKVKQIDGERKEKPVPKQEAAEDDAAKKGRAGAHAGKKNEVREGADREFLERDTAEAFINMMLAEEKKKRGGATDLKTIRVFYDERINQAKGVLIANFQKDAPMVMKVLEDPRRAEDGRMDIEELFGAYVKAVAALPADEKLRDEGMGKIKEKLLGEFKDLDEKEKMHIMRRFEEDLALYRILLNARLFRTIAEDEEMVAALSEVLARYHDRKLTEYDLRTFESTLLANANARKMTAVLNIISAGQSAVQSLTALQEQAQKKPEEQPKKEAQSPERSTTIVPEAIASAVSKLSDFGKNTVKKLMERGMSDVAITILQEKNYRETDRGIAASIAGGTLEASVRDGRTMEVYYISEDGVRIPIDLLEPLPTALDHVRSMVINQKIATALLKEHRDLNDQLMHALGGIDAKDEVLMEEEEARDWKLTLKLLLWKKTTLRDEEAALRELGILRENNHIDLVRSLWLRMYLKYQKGQKGLANVSFDELLEITRQWDADRSFSISRK